MISLDLARRLQDAGVLWLPGDGDRFMVPDRDLDDVVFVVSHMVVEVDDSPAGLILKFNGTTEWALDVVQSREVLWCRARTSCEPCWALGSSPWPQHRSGYVVVVDLDGQEERHEDPDVECAYARAVLSVLG